MQHNHGVDHSHCMRSKKRSKKKKVRFLAREDIFVEIKQIVKKRLTVLVEREAAQVLEERVGCPGRGLPCRFVGSHDLVVHGRNVGVDHTRDGVTSKVQLCDER